MVACALALAGCGLFDAAHGLDAAVGEPCGEALCAPGLKCCMDRCVSLLNDTGNCGGCGVMCGGAAPFCAEGTCMQAPCNPGTICGALLCCGSSCCAAGRICCDTQRSGARLVPVCVAPTGVGTCPPE